MSRDNKKQLLIQHNNAILFVTDSTTQRLSFLQRKVQRCKMEQVHIFEVEALDRGHFKHALSRSFLNDGHHRHQSRMI